MTSKPALTQLQMVLTFSNGRTSPERAEKAFVSVFGANGVIGKSVIANSPGNTIIIGRVGSYCGSVHFSKDACWVSDNAIRATAKGDNDPRFLYYLLKQLNLNNWRSGSGQPLLNQSTLNAIEAPIPSPIQQRAISGIAGAIDDRISLLHETNVTLEAIAQALFKSWFVDFDPVRAKVEGRAPEGMDEATAALFPDGFDESELGPVPMGWRVSTLSHAFEVNPKRSLKKASMASYLDMASLATSGHCVESPIQREVGSGAKFCNGDTLLARITPCLENGKTAFVDFLADSEIAWGSTEFVVLHPKAPLPEYFGYLLCRHQPFREYAINSMSGTSGRQRIQNDVLGLYPLVIPDSAIASAFREAIEPIQRSIAANHRMAQTLASLRDTLLPRLISGQLGIPEAETQIEAIAA